MTKAISRINTLRISFYAAWFIIAILQAYFTDLLEDEAYYWVFGYLNPDWGFYENSPAVGAAINLGYSLFQNELGVRLVSVLMITGYMYMLELLVKPKNLPLYYMTVSSIAVLHLVGILSVPDTPLLFFGMCFYHLYKRYLDKDTLLNSTLLAINLALLMFSKYHGILVIAFTIASNPGLFKRRSFWYITVLALLLFSPHIYWQYQNDFPTIKFNLSERFTRKGYSPIFTLNYIAGIPLLLAPIMGTLMLFFSFKRKPVNQFEKTLKYIVIGVLVFFGLMTFRGDGEVNWILSALAPAIILGYKYVEDKGWYPKFTKYAFAVSILLIAAVRIYMVSDIFGVNKYLLRDVHGWQAWANAIKEKANGKPVVFMNTYQHTSQYLFYSQEPLATSMNNRMAKRNQYDLWRYEDKMQGMDVMLVPNYDINSTETIATPLGELQYTYINNFRSASHINVHNKETHIEAQPSQVLPINVSFSKDSSFNVDVEANPDYPAKMVVMFFNGPNKVHTVYTEFYLKNTMLSDGKTYTVNVNMPDAKGSYTMFTDISMGWLPPSINSEGVSVEIK